MAGLYEVRVVSSPVSFVVSVPGNADLLAGMINREYLGSPASVVELNHMVYAPKHEAVRDLLDGVLTRITDRK